MLTEEQIEPLLNGVESGLGIIREISSKLVYNIRSHWKRSEETTALAWLLSSVRANEMEIDTKLRCLADLRLVGAL